MNSYHFLQHVTQQIRIPVIMMCVDQSTTPSLVMKAIEKGACGYWIKPLSEGQIKNIWQHVVRKVLKENNQHDQVLEILNVLKKKEGKEVSSQPSIIAWNNVHGINYFNELQTDTSLAIEAKLMKRWEFDNIAQSVSYMSSWFSGTLSEQLLLKEHLDSASREIFYDASRILLSGDLSERQALVEAEGISSDVSVCDKYLAKTAELLTSKCMTAPVEYAEYRKELAERYDFNQIGEPLPETVTLKDVITSLSKKVFEIDDVKAWKTVLISATSYALGLLMISKAPWYLLPLAWAWTGTAVNGFFVIGHDCAHKSFLTNKLVEDIVGTLAFYH
ncbi:hypothetical protein RYX36_021656 [Vicia faba]